MFGFVHLQILTGPGQTLGVEQLADVLNNILKRFKEKGFSKYQFVEDSEASKYLSIVSWKTMVSFKKRRMRLSWTELMNLTHNYRMRNLNASFFWQLDDVPVTLVLPQIPSNSHHYNVSFAVLPFECFHYMSVSSFQSIRTNTSMPGVFAPEPSYYISPDIVVRQLVLSDVSRV